VNRVAGRTVAEFCMWIAAALAIVAAVGPLLFAAGGSNRVSLAIVPFAVAAAALAVNAVTHRQSGWLSALLYAVAVLALLYAVVLVLSVPLRLSIQGSCEPAPQPCPLGFDRPLTAGESNGIYAAVISGGLALLFTFTAVELQYLRRPLLLNRSTTATAAPPAPAPPKPMPMPAHPATTPKPSPAPAPSDSPPTPPDADS
jgi:hypothetical protein